MSYKEAIIANMSSHSIRTNLLSLLDALSRLMLTIFL